MTRKQASYKAVKTGDLFEREITATNQKYLLQKQGVIEKIPTGVKPIPTQRGVRWLPAEKTGCDFIGHYKGTPVAIEAKSTASKTSFPLFTHGKEMVRPHQLRFLQRFEQTGGKAYVLIKFNHARRVFRVPVGDYTRLKKNATDGNKKSINIKLFEEYEVRVSDYLKGV